MTYDWSQFHLRMYYPAAQSDLFQRFATADGLASFFIHHADHFNRDGTPLAADEIVTPGTRYQWTYVHDYAHDGEYLSVRHNQHLAFTFGTMRVAVDFRSPDSKKQLTEVHLHQTDCATEDPQRAWQHLNCRSCWIYFLTNLRSVIQGGPDLRDHDHPQWNDSVSIGFEPDTPPGVPRHRV